MPDNNDYSLLTPRQVARRLQIEPRTLYEWVKTGRFPEPIRYSQRTIRWRESTLAEFLACQKQS